MAELVDEAHGEEGAGVDGLCRVGVLGLRSCVEAFRQFAAGRDVGEDDVAGEAEQQIIHAHAFAD